MPSTAFWRSLDRLVSENPLIIDRPRGTPHPRYSEMLYPLDYGYLQGTRSNDGTGIDIWLGSIPEPRVTAIVMTVDLLKRDAEMKLLIGCTPEEQQTILGIHDQSACGGSQFAFLLERPPSST